MSLLNDYKLRIHFILPGGGVRGAFQAGFLYRLFTRHKNEFDICRIDGTSVGSINGFSIMNEKYENLREIWYSINSINDLFDNWANRYLGNWFSKYRGFYKNGLYCNKKLNNILYSRLKESWDSFSDSYKKKFSCVVVNVDSAECKYISGDNKKIIDYVTASASPWIVSNPMKIDNTYFTDGCLLETYPIKYIDKCNADLTVIVGYDQEHIRFNKSNNDNLFEYLATLIDISRFNSENCLEIKNFIENESIVTISNPMKISFLDFNHTSIKIGFEQGEEFADSFYKAYIKKN